MFTCVEAFAAVNRTITGFERYHGLFTAFSANCGEHFALRTVVLYAHALFACLTASRATARFVSEAFFFVELLLGSSEYEFVAALAAG